MPRNNLVAAIDIGTTKTVVLIGEILPDRRLNIIGLGERPSTGLRKGEIFDMTAAKEVVHNAFSDAEKTAGVVGDVRHAYLSLTGSHLEGRRYVGSTSVATGRVSRDDIERAKNDAKRRKSADDRYVVHYVRQPFFLDAKVLANAENMVGKRLEVSYWTIDADRNRLEEVLHIPNDMGVHADDLIVSALASAAMVADETMKRNGVLVVDIGGGVTDYALYYNGYVVQTGVIPVGGDHITNDLALGLRVSRADAEEIKLKLARAYTGDDDLNATVLFQRGGSPIGGREFHRRSINAIVEARVDEIFRIIRKRLGRFGETDRVAAGAVVTGGTSLLNGLDTCAANALGLVTVVGQNPDWVTEELSGPKYSTALGLLQYALTGRETAPSVVTTAPKGLLASLRKLLPF